MTMKELRYEVARFASCQVKEPVWHGTVLGRKGNLLAEIGTLQGTLQFPCGASEELEVTAGELHALVQSCVRAQRAKRPCPLRVPNWSPSLGLWDIEDTCSLEV